MKAYKRYSQAKLAAGKNTIIRIGDLFIVGVTKEKEGIEEICVIDPEQHNRIVGNVTIRHLIRLGNANWAEKKDSRGNSVVGGSL